MRQSDFIIISEFRISFRINICSHVRISIYIISIFAALHDLIFLFIFFVFLISLGRPRLRLITHLLRYFYFLIWKFRMISRIGGLFAAKIRRYAIRSESSLICNSYLNIISIALSKRFLSYHFKNSGS
jgi:hypothetical protein